MHIYSLMLCPVDVPLRPSCLNSEITSALWSLINTVYLAVYYEAAYRWEPSACHFKEPGNESGYAKVTIFLYALNYFISHHIKRKNRDSLSNDTILCCTIGVQIIHHG